MRREFNFTTFKIDESARQRRELVNNMGSVIYFLGVVRGLEAGQPITAIDYEIFPEMARHQLNLIADEVEKRWPVASIRLVHRAGRVAAGEASLWVEVIAPHREEAFAACQFLISEMKRVVPIWKHPCPA